MNDDNERVDAAMSSNGDKQPIIILGISKRDYFAAAAAALTGMLAARSGDDVPWPKEDSTAELAYSYADEMLNRGAT